MAIRRVLSIEEVRRIIGNRYDALVKCSGCGGEFVRDISKYRNTWLASTNKSLSEEVKRGTYWHTECFDTWEQDARNINNEYTEEQEWSLVQNYLELDLNMKVDWSRCRQQWNRLIKNNKIYSPKGIRYALYYYYEIKHGDVAKANGGIGIVPFIYEDSKKYWYQNESKRRGFVAAIEEQILKREAKKIEEFKLPERHKRVMPTWSIEDIEEEVDN